ncbi:DoxX family protein [Rhodohalobacter sp.]|uniref:DoxX family protein n=1 Tax=Rhodohalobacter sp. TaxID=1974210 RepID=UPI002ACD71E2|nr:DoxX family protein [Rhodohalobacter sp.]MDZ7757997.1 DoxX family protein [Rhodohalobacter sp.]
MKNSILSTEPQKTTLLIRFMVGFYFLAGGVIKLSYPELQDTGFFQNLGFISAGAIVSVISLIEIICGLMIIAGLFTRIAVIPLLLTISFTVLIGKFPILFEEGFWMMAHISRIDFAMFFGCVFLFITGSGFWSLDWKMQAKEA